MSQQADDKDYQKCDKGCDKGYQKYYKKYDKGINKNNTIKVLNKNDPSANDFFNSIFNNVG